VSDKELPSKVRILLIGLDSADLALLEPWMGSGELPNLARLAQEGNVGLLRSTTPPISPVAWATFATGKNPGKHAIFDFREPGVRKDFVSTESRKGRSLWQLLSEAGSDVGVINLPFSYPPEPVGGFFVSGYGTPSTKSNYTYPPELREEIDQICPGYRIHVHAIKYDYWRRFDRYLHHLHNLVERRTCLARHLLSTRPWDVAMATYFATDTIQHIAWHLADPTHPAYDPREAARHGDPILALYRHVDSAVGELVEIAMSRGDPTLVIVLSDHGGTAIQGYISLNTWLEREALLHYRQKSLPALWGRLVALVGLSGHRGLVVRGKRLCAALEHRVPSLARWLDVFPGWLFADGPARVFEEIDWKCTRAYAYGDYGQIHLNLKGKTPHGVVEEGRESEALLERIRQGLKGQVDAETGERAVEDCIRLQELYTGPYRERAADLLVISRPGYLLESTHDQRKRIVGRESAPTRKYSGMHRPEGLFIAWGPIIIPGRIHNARLMDIAPTVLYAAGHDVPNDMDGRILEELFAPEFRASHPPHYTDLTAGEKLEGSEQPVYSAREARELEERLRSLGYLE
jgi:predicted AlkP superfamily phosphohydrolase/phosphomutase